jgi:hypothetical protein
VSQEIGLQVQVNNGISQLLTDDHYDEQKQDDVVSSNNQQDMLVNENVIQVNGTNICNQGVPKENVKIIRSAKQIIMGHQISSCHVPVVTPFFIL